MPNFAEDVGVGVGLFHNFPEVSPELVIYLIRDIQAPAVDPDLLDPILCNTQQILLDLGVFRIQLRHMRLEGECIVSRHSVLNLQRELAHDEPVLVARLLALLQDINKRSERFAGMIEDRVEQDANASFMTSLHKYF
ncbi:hypothetical protein D3C77_367570 [compost metagenome]